MKTKIKICGIRDLESAEIAIEQGADFLGLNFVPASKRLIDLTTAKTIVEKVKGRIALVGIFQNQSIEEINNTCEFLQLDFVQLHGDEDEIYMKKINNKIIKRVVIPSEVEGSYATKQQSGVRFFDSLSVTQNDKVEYVLIDRNVQGEGKMVDLDTARKISEKFQVFFSGGLTAENVGMVIKKVKPFAVDVASGIETDGFHDVEKIKQFIKAVKEVQV